MLSLVRREIGPIAPVLSEVHPNADTNQIGSWGILYLTCGALAGQSIRWASVVFDSIDISHEWFLRSMLDKPSEMDLTLGFKKLIFEWAQDSAGLAIARGRLADLERRRGKELPDNSRLYFLNYGRLAIMLNSLSKLETNEIAQIRRWATDHEDGWATLFFGAGVLLTVEKDFPWLSIGSGLLMSSHTAKEKVKMLFDRFSNIR